LGREAVAGGKLKESGYGHWVSPNTGATNSTGFTALPGGYRVGSGLFDSIGSFGLWWSSTESVESNARYRYLSYGFANLYRGNDVKVYGFSVRCIKDI